MDRLNTTNNTDFCNNTPLFGDDTYRTFCLIVNVIVVSIVVLFGLVGNTISFVVLGQARSTTTRFLRVLAVADSLYLVVCLQFQTLQSIVRLYPSINIRLNRIYPYVQLICWPLISTFQTAAVYFVVLVTVERYFAICYPISRNFVLTGKTAGWAIFGVAVGSLIYNIPTAFDLQTRLINVTVDCETVPLIAIRATALFSNPIYQLIYKTVLHFIFRTGLPLLAVISLDVCLIRAVMRSARYSHRYPATTGTEAKFTSTVICLVVVFVTCQLPDFAFRLLRTITMTRWPIMTMTYLGDFTNLLLTLNSSVNFLIYVMTGNRFRRLLMEKFCWSSSSSSRHGLTSPKIMTASSSSPRTTTSTKISETMATRLL